MECSIFKDSYICPHCEAYSQQYWYTLVGHPHHNSGNYGDRGASSSVAKTILGSCQKCHMFSIWIDNIMIYPVFSSAPLPNVDMPSDIIGDFEEARQISAISPRGAAALLRLCIQKLCANLGEEGKDINRDIASLVKKGLSPIIQQALDAVRVIGNEAVHPGTLDLRDDKKMTNGLFELVNLIVEQMISQPKRVQAMYAKLPEAKLIAIQKRDGK